MQVSNRHDDETLPRSVKQKTDRESAPQCEPPPKKKHVNHFLYLIEEQCSVWIQILSVKKNKTLSVISATQCENKNETLSVNSVTQCENKDKILSVNSAS